MMKRYECVKGKGWILPNGCQTMYALAVLYVTAGQEVNDKMAEA
jgi:hypothetical protein